MRKSNKRTPKVFHSNYRPPRKIDWSSYYTSLKPALMVGLILFGVFMLGRLPVFSIKTITVAGSDNAAVNEKIQLLKGQSIFSRYIQRQQDRIEAEHYEISGLSCRRGIPDTLRCEVVERQPALVWQANGKSYILDREGIVFAESHDSVADIPVVVDRIGQEVKLGDRLLTQGIAEQYINTDKLLGERGFVVKNLFINESFYQFGAVLTGTMAEGLTFASGREVDALFVTSYSLEAQVATLVTIFQQQGDKIQTYVDVRVPGYLYYK